MLSGAFKSLSKESILSNLEELLQGLNRNIIKAHGSSNRNHISGAINCFGSGSHDMLGQVMEDVKGANEILRPEPLNEPDIINN